MKMNRIRLTALAVLLIGLAIVPVSPAHAQTAGIEVKPAIIDAKVNPGEVYPFAITIRNISATPQTLDFGTKDISSLDESGHPIFAKEGEATSYSLSSWVIAPQGPITLQPGESRSMTFAARIPAQVSPGAHFGGVFFNSAADKTSGNGSAIAYQVGSILSLQVAGDIVENGRIREFSTDRLVYGSPAINFITKMENQGNVLMRPHGVVTITDMFGKEVGTLTVNDNAAPVFPSSVRAYTSAWSSEDFAFGRYQAVLSISYGDEAKRTASATTSFWVIPFKTALITLVTLLAFVLVVYGGMRRYIKSQLRAMGVKESDQNANYYARKHGRAGSPLMLPTIGLVILCIVALIALFALFA